MTAAGLPADPAWTALTAQSLPGAPVTAVLCADRAQTEAVLRAASSLAGWRWWGSATSRSPT